ncbi:unnamed protein product, partial [Ectocarpus sp. 4 AP-2014]
PAHSRQPAARAGGRGGSRVGCAPVISAGCVCQCALFTYFRTLLVKKKCRVCSLSLFMYGYQRCWCCFCCDAASMSHRSKVTGSVEEKREAPWEEALRSQMPRFGRPDAVQFKPILPDGGTSHSPDRDQVAVVFAFFQEQFVVRRVMLREEGSGSEEGRRLKRLVVTSACAGGEVVKIRSDPVCRVSLGPPPRGGRAGRSLVPALRVPGGHGRARRGCVQQHRRGSGSGWDVGLAGRGWESGGGGPPDREWGSRFATCGGRRRAAKTKIEITFLCVGVSRGHLDASSDEAIS